MKDKLLLIWKHLKPENLQKMWLEDDKSLEEKLKLLDTYQLAGGAFWKLGFESSEIWTLIGQYL